MEKIRIARFVSALLLLTSPAGAPAETLFGSDTPLELTLIGPLGRVIESGKENEEFSFTLDIGGRQLPLQVRTRGKSRLRVCSFPPLRLDFDRSAAAGTVFSGQDKLKLVTHCSDRRSDDNALLDEYTAYRIFQQLSDYAFQVRLVNLSYRDTDEPDRNPLERQAFLIEADEALAARTGGEVRKQPGVVYSHLDDEQAALVYVFQYLIGNTDWSLVAATDDDACCHNGELLGIDGKLVLVPYDFDLSGIVDASYARPDASLRIRNVRTRRYRGYCTSPETLRAALRRVLAAESAILQVANETPAATEKDLAKRIAYIEKFYGEADNEDKMMRNFERRCLD